MTIGAAAVVITLIIVACFEGSGCWDYEWIHRGKYCTVLTALGRCSVCAPCELIARNQAPWRERNY
jgi:hypothetical protein